MSNDNSEQQEKPKKLYLVWNEDDEFAYFEQFDSLEDAVRSEKTEVYIATIRRLGVFQKKNKVVRIKPRKKAKKP